ncbi:hypothetical protein HYT00_02000 [Candidatus Giovannonibacteria bacterium]|nr:hypothetical protein [Candidatus Giovannonibacteria bacterium]
MKKIIEGFGLMTGMIIGAGLFALPYGFSKAPLHWNILLLVAVFLLSWFLHLLFAGIIYITPGRHRFPGYVKKYLGHRAETIAAIFTILSAYGVMLVYGILGSIFLGNIFQIDFILAGIIFFALGGLLFLFSLDTIGKVDFYLTVLLLFFIVLISSKLFPAVNINNFHPPENPTWFFSYGILIFAFGGYSALPDLRDIFGGNGGAISKKIIFWSLFVAAVFYLIFIISVLGASGGVVSEDAISGLGGIIGPAAKLMGSIIGIIAVFRSYTVFGADLKLMFTYDYKLSKKSSWLLSFLPPVTFFLLGLVSLADTLSIVGSVGLGVFAVFTFLMVYKKRKEISSFVGFRPRGWLLFLLGALFVSGALYDIIKISLLP